MIPTIHRQIYDSFAESVTGCPELLSHRQYVEKHNLGYGDRAFHWLWNLLVNAMPPHFRFLELGVYKGQVLSLIALLASWSGKTVDVVGVTPLCPAGDKYGEYEEADYRAAIRDMQNWCGLPEINHATLIEGFSTEDRVKDACRRLAPFDMIYVDGCHAYQVVVNDIVAYSEMLIAGGLLIMDDAATELKLPNDIWPGHPDVSRAVRELLLPDPRFAIVASVGHLRVWRKLGRG